MNPERLYRNQTIVLDFSLQLYEGIGADIRPFRRIPYQRITALQYVRWPSSYRAVPAAQIP
jgi:hypothetical protein